MAAGTDPLDAGPGPQGPPPGIAAGAASGSIPLSEALWDVNRTPLGINTHLQNSPLKDDPLIQAIIKSVSELNVAIGELTRGFNAHQSMFGDVHSRLVRPIDAATGKGTGLATMQLRSEIDALKHQLSVFD